MPPAKRIPAMQQPKQKRRSNKLVIVLFLFFMLVLTVLFLHSSISKVGAIHIKGNHLVATSKIGQATGVSVGDNFFTVMSSRVKNNIKQLPGISSVSVEKHFPGLIDIQVEEFQTVAYQIQSNGLQEAVLEDGSTIPLTGENVIVDKPVLSGWKSDNPLKAKLAKTLATISDTLLTDISEIKPEPSNSFPDKIKMYTNSHFEIITTIDLLPKKITYIRDLISNHKPGVITLLLSDYYGPYGLYSDQPSKVSQN